MHAPPELMTLMPLVLVAVVVAMVAGRFKLPYAIALVVTGLMLTPLRLNFGATLDPGLLVTVLLPPLLFESALNLRISLLYANWRPIALYAVLGTVLSSLFVGYLATWVLGLPLAAALVFGALIASTDPISVVAVFKQCRVGRRLGILVEGESLFNDGVSVVLYGVLLGVATSGAFSFPEVLGRFVTVVLGGAAVGLAVGLLASRLTREFDDPPLEITLTCLVAWGSFLLAEHVHVSGVIATVIAGLTVDAYGMHTGMSPSTRVSVNSFWEFAAFLANSLVFLLLGIQESLVNFWGDLGAIAAAFLLVLGGRALSVYGLSPLVNGLGGGIPTSWLHVMVWSGLRGALAVALVSSLPPNFPERERLIHLTYGVVLFSLLLQGTTVGWVLRRLGITGSGEDRLRDFRLLQLRQRAARKVLAELEERSRSGMPAPIAEEVGESYRKRLTELDAEVAMIHVSRADLFEEQRLEAHKLALAVEKDFLHQAHRDGLLSEGEMLEWLAPIDGELHALHEPPEPQPVSEASSEPSDPGHSPPPE